MKRQNDVVSRCWGNTEAPDPWSLTGVRQSPAILFWPRPVELVEHNTTSFKASGAVPESAGRNGDAGTVAESELAASVKTAARFHVEALLRTWLGGLKEESLRPSTIKRQRQHINMSDAPSRYTTRPVHVHGTDAGQASDKLQLLLLSACKDQRLPPFPGPGRSAKVFQNWSQPTHGCRSRRERDEQYCRGRLVTAGVPAGEAHGSSALCSSP